MRNEIAIKIMIKKKSLDNTQAAMDNAVIKSKNLSVNKESAHRADATHLKSTAFYCSSRSACPQCYAQRCRRVSGFRTIYG